jgi:hypothetical protein
MKSASVVLAVVIVGVGAMSAYGLTDQSAMPVATPGSLPVVREIDDAQEGLRWLLVKNADTPGPGKLIPVARESVSSRNQLVGRNQSVNPRAGEAGFRPVIRAGEALTIEEYSDSAQIRLEGTATIPAAVGQIFKVRLMAGSATVNAIAIGPHRAKLTPLREANR